MIQSNSLQFSVVLSCVTTKEEPLADTLYFRIYCVATKSKCCKVCFKSSHFCPMQFFVSLQHSVCSLVLNRCVLRERMKLTSCTERRNQGKGAHFTPMSSQSKPSSPASRGCSQKAERFHESLVNFQNSSACCNFLPCVYVWDYVLVPL